MTNQTIAFAYLAAFCAGDVAGVEATLADEFSLKGPLFSFNSKQEYLASLRRDLSPAARFEPIEVFASGDAVAVFYAYIKPHARNTIAQLFRFRGGKIAEILLVFDSAAVG